MPIKPENKPLYPADWQAIRAEVLWRDRYTCAWEGCTAVHRARGGWHGEHWMEVVKSNHTKVCEIDKRAPVQEGQGEVDWDALAVLDSNTEDDHGCKVIEIVLTIAHLDHDPRNNGEPGNRPNLKAMCQRHHLRYDAKHHAETAYATRHARKAIGELF